MDSEEQLDYGEEEEEDGYDGPYDDGNVGLGFAGPATSFGIGALPDRVADGPTSLGVPVVGPEGNGFESGGGALQPELKSGSLLPGEGPDGIPDRSDSASDAVRESNGGSIGFRGNSALAPLRSNISVDRKFGDASSSLPSDPGNDGAKSQPLMPPNPPAIATGDRPTTDNSLRTDGGVMDDSGSTLLFVGELHWWTTDVELESVLSRHGRVKEVKFFDEKTGAGLIRSTTGRRKMDIEDYEQRDQDYNNEDNLDRSSSSSRSQSNFRMAQEVDRGFGLREADYGKRRRIPLE